jgi:hypothetical protein
MSLLRWELIFAKVLVVLLCCKSCKCGGSRSEIVVGWENVWRKRSNLCGAVIVDEKFDLRKN